MSLLKQYLNLKYNTIYFPFNQNGSESSTQSISSNHNFGGNKKIEIGGGKTSEEDYVVMGYYGNYCIARGLLGFDTINWDHSISSYQNTLTANLRLYHNPSTNYVPSSLTIEIYPITASWDAGSYTEAVPTEGKSNWWYRDSTNLWSTSGGWDVHLPMSSSITLTPSNLDIEMSITNLVKHSLSSGMRYYGLLLKLPNTIETATASINFKKEIYAGDFSLPYQLPRIDIQYDDQKIDDRSSFIVGQSNRLYFYNTINGNLFNMNFSSATAHIKDEDDITITSTTSVSNSAGEYFIDITIPVSSFKENKRYRDVWIFNIGSTTAKQENYIDVIGITNNSFDLPSSRKIKLDVEKQESERNLYFRVSPVEDKFFFFKSWAKDVKQQKYYPSNAWFRVYTLINDSNYEKYYMTDWDKLSKDKNGLYFELDKTLFQIGKYYLEFKMNIFDGTYYYADKKHLFRVTQDFSELWT